MANIAPSLSPLDITHAPEGGEIGAVQSGWRLALREFARNKLAVAGIAILLFYVVFCFAGPVVLSRQHGQLRSRPHQPAARQAGFPLGTTTRASTNSGLLMKGGQAALEVGFVAAFIGIVIGMLVGRDRRAGRRHRGLGDDARGRHLPVDPVPVHRADRGRPLRRVRARAQPHHWRVHLAGAGPAGQGRGAHAADAGLRLGGPNALDPAGGG